MGLRVCGQHTTAADYATPPRFFFFFHRYLPTGSNVDWWDNWKNRCRVYVPGGVREETGEFQEAI